MKLFSKFFKPTIGSRSLESIKQLSKWHISHFFSNGYSVNKAANFQIYRTDSGERLNLAQIKTPLQKISDSKGFLGKIKAIAENIDRPYLPVVLSEYHDKIKTETDRFKGNLKKLECLSSIVKEDTLFDEIDHIFDSKLRILHNELLFCKFENLGNEEYFLKISRRLSSLIADMNSLNTDFADYMYALTNAQYENIKTDLDNIRIRVEAMSEVTSQYADECI
ncbi:MAG: hypothetical protein ACI4I9_02665 [Porcipelethomonas sp.]